MQFNNGFNDFNNNNQMYSNMNSGCCCKKPNDSCKIINKCFLEEIPQYYNCHTHVVNNCIKRHINIPVYSQDEETVIHNQCVNGNPMYTQNMNQQPFFNQMNNNPFMF